MDIKSKEAVDLVVNTMARLMLFVADELEPADDVSLLQDLDTIYRALVSIERCARQWKARRTQN